MQSLVKSATPSLFSSACVRQPSSCAIQLNFVRWRKPRWIPVAKSKRYFVSRKVFTQEPDRSERKSLNDKYFTSIKSIWAHQKGIHLGRMEEAKSSAAQRSFDAELEKIMSENDKINAEVAARRDKLREETWKKWEEEIVAMRLQNEIEEEQQFQLTQQQVLAQMERLKTAIKIEDLDTAIENALNTEVDYNFAIDKNGKIYPGRHNNSVPQKSDSIVDEKERLSSTS